MNRANMSPTIKIVLGTLALSSMIGCHIDMWIQPKEMPLEESTFYNNKMVSRKPVEGTIAFGSAPNGTAFSTGFENGKLIKEIPIEVTKQALYEGKWRYEAFCSHCHGLTGEGNGMIAQRGLELQRPVGNFNTDRVRNMPDGFFFDVITNGFGVMYPQAAKHTPEQRWKIVAYIRALQLSQNAEANKLSPEDVSKVQESLLPKTEEGDGHAKGESH